MTTQEYLDQYQAARRNVEYWQGRVEEAKARAEKTTAGIGGMPSAPNPQKLQQAVDVMQDAKRRLSRAVLIMVSAREKVANAVKLADNEKQREILHKRYLAGLTMPQIAEKMGYCLRTVQLIHAAAVKAVDKKRST